MNIGIIGMGYWGPNLVRNLVTQKDVANVFCCDLSEERLKSIRQNFPSVQVTVNYKDLLSNPSIDGICIATPVSLHYKLASEALLSGKNVLIEKPMTDSVKDAEALVELAEQKKLVLMVDHTFIYTGAIRKIKELVDTNEIGNILYFDSVRINLGLFQHDVNVVWDLAPHDISIMNYIINEQPVSVYAVGANHINGKEDVAYITIKFSTNIIAHFNVNWLSPVKIRRILIGGDQKMIVYDDMQPSEKIKIYNKGIEIQSQENIRQLLIQYRMGDMLAPNIDSTEALTLVCNDFVESCLHQRKPLCDGIAGLNVVRILEASQQSLQRGRPVKIQQ
ncbi:MAG: Gfo/Idh/MocA family oxidoreductase [Bacteroidota bacterium]